MIFNRDDGVTRYSSFPRWEPALWLMSATELASMEIAAPAVAPAILDTATETAAALCELAASGELGGMSPYNVAKALRAPYVALGGPKATAMRGFAMLAEADRADALTVIVFVPATAPDPVWTVRPMRLRDRIASFGPEAQTTLHRQARERFLESGGDRQRAGAEARRRSPLVAASVTVT